MKKLALIWFFAFFITSPILIAQNFQDVVLAEDEEEVDEICKSVYSGAAFMDTPKEVENIVNQIVQTAGVSNGGFQLKQCSNISNAIAKMLPNRNGDEIRYIIYDAEWLKSIVDDTSNDWSGQFVLAHEIGHHLNGHSLNNGTSNHKFELEADYFAGRALANLGATLEETLAVTNEMGTNATSSHPARADRAAQAEAGWKSISNKQLTIQVKDKEVSEIAKILVSKIDEKLSSSSNLTKEDYQKTLKQLRLARGPKYYKGYTEDIRYFEAICYYGMENEEKAMDSYINYLSIEGLDKSNRIKQISTLYAESPSKSTAFFANPLVVYNLSKVYYKNKEYDNAISLGNQFLTRSTDENKKRDIIEIIATSEFEKIENEVAGLTPSEAITQSELHIQNQEYTKAVDLLSPLANNNNTEAQYLLGYLVFEGKGTTANASKAAELFIKAAQSNNAKAQYALGLMYRNGTGVVKNLDNARFWLTKAEENNLSEATAELSKLNDIEKKNANKPTPVVKKEVIESDSESLAKKIVKADSYFNNDMYADSYSLYMEAAVKGDAHSQFKVGWMLYKGKGVSKNKNLAYDWWKKAARQGHADSINYLTRLGKW
ncbi:sel1 repeat family protein [Ulvibacter litoralis]|uniref:Sel1 repeat-containing protein n=1 Tax=Ulvibacter litoralis TaxID=227084 RepID=A0A1G7GQL6_9FLAO|nr:sel1 repeat family protein [Ulvibacter litoralis]GHC55416.1 hypothetical protein GCM10008083_19440 [Ulvibacter litoralis]SDE90432.1 Sel1 repeat-containing protein [Ulvibacter litoralis]